MRIINEAGGEMNGTTNKDRTNYFETVPANQLEKVLWLEADRMGSCRRGEPEEAEIQRATVKNERAHASTTSPMAWSERRVGGGAHPRTHPYSRSPSAMEDPTGST